MISHNQGQRRELTLKRRTSRVFFRWVSRISIAKARAISNMLAKEFTSREHVVFLQDESIFDQSALLFVLFIMFVVFEFVLPALIITTDICFMHLTICESLTISLRTQVPRSVAGPRSEEERMLIPEQQVSIYVKLMVVKYLFGSCMIGRRIFCTS